MPGETVPELLDEIAVRRRGAEAAVFPDSRSTYDELQASSRAMARRLHAAGLGRGDFVGVMLGANVDNVNVLLGAMRLGAIPVTINDRLKVAELCYVMQHSGMRLLIADPNHGALIAEASVEACRTVLVGEDQDFEAAADAVDDSDLQRLTQAVSAEDRAILLYTSGTTSNPKGALHSHASLVAEGRNLSARLGLGPDDRFWSPLPMYHCGGIVTMLGAFSVGATFCHAGTRFDPGRAIEQLERERCTHAFSAFETMWQPILDHPSFSGSHLALRVVINVAVPERLRAMQDRTPQITQISCFGSTESCGFMCMGDTRDSLEVRCTTSGRPLPGMELRVVDPETGADVAQGETGEALFRGPTRFMRYHNDPEFTAQTIDADGWFHSGDLVRQDAEGRVSFMGRLKDMLKVGGENVSAAEVENFLATHPAVQIVQVVGAPDARYIEVPAAFVELRPGASATEEELIQHCLGQISTYKVPRYVRFVQEWPLSGTKIQKFRLRARIAAELQAAGSTEAPTLRSAVRS